MSKAITTVLLPSKSNERQATMPANDPLPPRSQAGQALVIMVGAMIAMLAMTALVVDGGNAFAQQRATQNGADAAAEAGAVVLAENLAGGSHSDQEVLAAVQASAAKNAITLASALYTNVNGNSLGVSVGSLGTNRPPAAAAGVRTFSSRTFGTYVGGIVGIKQLSASAQATAVAGPSAGCSQGCALLPITFPVNPTTCDGTGAQIQVGSGPYPIVDANKRTANNESILGICGTANGSVGWLAIQPEDNACGGGVNDLVCDIATPDSGSITFPIWLGTLTGNTNSNPVTKAMNQYEGQLVLIPFYDCVKDDVGQLSPGPACPSPAQTTNGSHTYYHVVGVYGFYLDQAYINGSNPECNQPPGNPQIAGNGMNGCLKGWFVQVLSSGAVGSGPYTPGGAVSVQLVR